MKRAVVVILSYSVLAFAFCLGLSAFMGNTQSILEDYRQSYVFCRGFLYFFRILFKMQEEISKKFNFFQRGRKP